MSETTTIICNICQGKGTVLSPFRLNVKLVCNGCDGRCFMERKLSISLIDKQLDFSTLAFENLFNSGVRINTNTIRFK